jgi:hypothetical protein
MTAEQLFSMLNLIAVAGWLLLVILPRVRWTSTLVPIVLPSLFAVIYVALIAATLNKSEGGFVPALVLTFLFGPAGLLLYLAIRRFAGRTT